MNPQKTLTGLAVVLAVLLFAGIVGFLTSSRLLTAGQGTGELIDETAAVQDVPDVEDRIAAVEQELADYKAAIGDNPEAAVRLPLLATELEDLERRVDDLAAQLEREADTRQAADDQNYDLTKWIFGLLLAGVVGLLISRALADRRQASAPAVSIDLDALLALAKNHDQAASGPADQETSTRSRPKSRAARNVT